MDGKDRKTVKFNPDLVLEKTAHFSDPVKVAIQVATIVGSGLYSVEGGKSLCEVNLKSGDEGERAVQLVTRGDKWAQSRICLSLLGKFPEARFIIEEKMEGFQVDTIQRDNLSLVHEADLVFIVDPIDGTNQFYPGLWEWSVSIGVMVKGKHIGGVIFAPAVLGGALIVGERGRGVFLAEKGGFEVGRVFITSPEKEKKVLYTGAGLAFLPNYNGFTNAAARELPVFKSVGSCALGLAFVAAGRINAMIQPAQRPYDWGAGYPLVEEAGGEFRFYHYRDGNIVLLDGPDFLSYDPGGLRTAFMAGDPKMVDWLFELLLQNWGK